ncbi:MAG: hypothetical protein K2X47_02070, partial [Bdellovibrionales bacterium]|nr:hypothetical protein [Bdellovibrionales bacterium]
NFVVINPPSKLKGVESRSHHIGVYGDNGYLHPEIVLAEASTKENLKEPTKPMQIEFTGAPMSHGTDYVVPDLVKGTLESLPSKYVAYMSRLDALERGTKYVSGRDLKAVDFRNAKAIIAKKFLSIIESCGPLRSAQTPNPSENELVARLEDSVRKNGKPTSTDRTNGLSKESAARSGL